MLHVDPIHAFNDNYIWCIYDDISQQALIVDPGDAKPVIAFLQRHKLKLTGILITHRHYDHVQGVSTLHAKYQCPVFGPAQLELDQLSYRLKNGDDLHLLGLHLEVIAVPGHTEEHIAFFGAPSPQNEKPWLFCGDTLFSGGCGRLLGGSAEQLYDSLGKLSALPAETQVYCAHEYTLANLAFAIETMPSNPELAAYLSRCEQKRAISEPTIPSDLGTELKINPFLRSFDKELKSSLEKHFGNTFESEFEVFKASRLWKDSF